MIDLQWTPEMVGRLTIVQLFCLSHEYPPGSQPVTTPDEYEAAINRLAAEKAAWTA